MRHKGLLLFMVACLPWLVLPLLAYFDLVILGTVAGLVIVGFMFLLMPPGRKWGILQPFSLLFFIVASAAAIALGSDLDTRVPNLLAGGFACLMIMGGYGLLEGISFPSNYIFIDYPESMRESPILLRALLILAWAWDTIFVLGFGINVICMLALRGHAAISLASISSAFLISVGIIMTPLLVLTLPRRMESTLVEKGSPSVRWQPQILTPGRPLLKNEYDAVVVGSGIGGLACASILSISGMKVFMAEKSRLPGGYCNTYDWQGYPLNAGPTMIMGGEGSVMGALLRRLGLEREIPLKRLDWGVADGKIALRLGQGIDSDLGKLGNKFPSSREGLQRMFQDLQRFRGEVMDRADFLVSPLPSNLEEYHEEFLRHPVSARWQNSSFQSVLDDYLHDDGIKRLFTCLASLLGGDPRTFPAYEGGNLLTSLFLNGIFYPAGHFSLLTRRMAEVVRESGGEIITSCGVEEVLLKGDGARTLPIGLRLADGSQVRSNVVILNVDPRRALSGLLQSSSLGMDFVKEMEKLKPSCSAFVLHLIFEDDLRLPDRIFLFPTKPRRVRTGDTYIEIDSIILSKEKRDEGGKGCVLVARINVPHNCYHIFESDDSGKELGAELAAVVKEEMGNVFPAIKKSVKEFMTIPTQFSQLTANNQGSAFGFAPILGQWYYKRFGPQLPIPNTYLVGAWSRYGGGVEGAALSGIMVARELCGERTSTTGPTLEPIPFEEEIEEDVEKKRRLFRGRRARPKEDEDDAE